MKKRGRSQSRNDVFLRGGNWNETTNAGAFTLNLNNNTGNQNNNIGFRCASDTTAHLPQQAPDEQSVSTDADSGSTRSQDFFRLSSQEEGKNKACIPAPRSTVREMRRRENRSNASSRSSRSNRSNNSKTSLFRTITESENLLKAFYRARSGKRENPKICEYDFFLENNLITLQRQVRSGQYEPSPYVHFMVDDPKRRQVAAPAFRDRVLHHSLVGQIEPLFDRKFIYDSYACRRGKGTHFGARRVKKFLMAARTKYGKQQEVYVLQCDITKFFQTISWSVLYTIICRTITCPDTRELIHRIITHHHETANSQPTQQQLSLFAPSGDEILPVVSREQRRGLPIGNLTSQLFANIYLSEFDHFVKEVLRERWYARYMDDFLVIHPDKEHLKQVRSQMSDFLNTTLKLTLHPRKNTIKNVKEGISFVGYRIFYDHILIRGSTLLRMERHYRRRLKQLKAKQMTPQAFKQSESSMMGHLQYASAHGLVQHFRHQRKQAALKK